MQEEGRIAERCHGEWDINNALFQRCSNALGALPSTVYPVGRFWQGMGRNQSSEPGEEKGGGLGSQMLSLPLTFAGSLTNDREARLCFFSPNDFQPHPSPNSNWRPLYF